MNKQDILNNYKKQEDRFLLSQVLDKIDKCKKNNKIEDTDFLDMYQIALLKSFFRKIDFKNYVLFGGYQEAERKIIIIFPDGYNISMIEKNYSKIIKGIRIILPEQRNEKIEYSHRNYLGAIIKVGMRREKVGDIIVSKNGADILIKQESAESLMQELKLLNRFENSSFQLIDISDLNEPDIKIEEVNIIVPSLRLDNFVSDLARTSRNKAVQIINSERVFVNGQNETKPAKQVKIGDVITIRGKGRFVVKEFVGSTRSGRSVVRIEKFV